MTAKTPKTAAPENPVTSTRMRNALLALAAVLLLIGATTLRAEMAVKKYEILRYYPDGSVLCNNTCPLLPDGPFCC